MSDERKLEGLPKGGVNEGTLQSAPVAGVKPKPRQAGVKVEVSDQAVRILDRLAFEAGLPTGSITKLKESRRRLLEALIAVGGGYLEEKIKRHGLAGCSFTLEELEGLAEKVRGLVE